jgi:hypothetical protein
MTMASPRKKSRGPYRLRHSYDDTWTVEGPGIRGDVDGRWDAEITTNWLNAAYEQGWKTERKHAQRRASSR